MTTSICDIVEPFYNQALTVNQETVPAEVMASLLADNFESQNGQEVKDKSTLMKQVSFFWELIPDLKWEPQEKVVEGNKCVIRSIATGSPKGNFMGVELDGSKSFKIDTIDIHTVEDGKIVHVYHLEDWVTAMKQLKG